MCKDIAVPVTLLTNIDMYMNEKYHEHTEQSM